MTDAKKCAADPRRATVAELRAAQAMITKHALWLKFDAQTNYFADDAEEGPRDAGQAASGMYASAALVLAGAIRKEYGK